MFKSRCVFSMTFAASAVCMFGARWIWALITLSYTFATISNVFLSDPETIFDIDSRLCALSPGLILSGEYPTKKPSPKLNPEQVSKIISSDNEVIHKLQAIKKREVSKNV